MSSVVVRAASRLQISRSQARVWILDSPTPVDGESSKLVVDRDDDCCSRRFATKKSIPWKCLARKHEPHRFHDANMEKDVTQRISSARLHKIKELRNELYDVQRTLEAVNVENKMLKRLQQRHIRALHKFESAENDLHQLIKRHNSEVRALRQSLRMSQVQERYVSRRLKETEKELLRTKDNVYDLQKLSDDNNLAERSELSRKLSDLTVRMEADDKNIKLSHLSHFNLSIPEPME
ncbi:hypothetical protein FKM82_030349 [Ascaphus truei]